MNSYQKFSLMMAVSFIVMYGVMFLNADQFAHVMLSNTRTYMTILMIAPMILIMMGFMWGMYKRKIINYITMGAAVVVFVFTLLMLRNQTLISDIQYMKAMIPHHSSAIMVSQKANLKDPEVKKLAKEIIEAQKREIELMNNLIEKIEQNK